VTQPHPWDAAAPDGRHIWKTLGYRFVEGGPEDRVTLEWEASGEYTFPNAGWTIVHGGMVTTLLDTAMGHVCLAHIGPDETFLTADLQVEFYRAARPGTLRAEAEVRHQSRRTVFCAASLYDAEGTVLASARCTQIVKSVQ
jgi:uncharacterized protein (TIGR00369 family)